MANVRETSDLSATHLPCDHHNTSYRAPLQNGTPTCQEGVVLSRGNLVRNLCHTTS